MTSPDTPELSYVVKLADVDRDFAGDISANAAEKNALARRFDLVAIQSLSAEYELKKEGAKVQMKARIAAELQQSCAVTGDPVQAQITEAVDLLFCPEEDTPSFPDAGSVRDIEPETGDEEGIELAAADCDIVHYTGQAIDIGEAIAQSLYLALDAYPRSAGADAVAEENLQSEAAAGPFGGLSDMLKDR